MFFAFEFRAIFLIFGLMCFGGSIEVADLWLAGPGRLRWIPITRSPPLRSRTLVWPAKNKKRPKRDSWWGVNFLARGSPRRLRSRPAKFLLAERSPPLGLARGRDHWAGMREVPWARARHSRHSNLRFRHSRGADSYVFLTWVVLDPGSTATVPGAPFWL